MQMEKFKVLMEDEGFNDPIEFLEEECMGFGYRAGVPAICTNLGCNYCCDMEPDQDRGWCEECGTNSVKSALILYGII